MLWFPSYDLEKVLDMYSSAFFQLFEEAAHIEASRRRFDAAVASVPHMEETARSEFIDSLDRAADDPRDILLEDEDYSDIHKLKELLG